MRELNPCPFCGGEAYVEQKGKQFYVQCFHKENCYLAGITPRKFNIRYSLVKKWNRRTETGVIADAESEKHTEAC